MPELGVLSYALASVAFCVLAILALVSDRRLREGRALGLAGALSAAWAGLFAIFDAGLSMPSWLIASADVSRYAGWFWFLLVLLPPSLPRLIRIAPAVLLFAWAIFGLLDSDVERVLTRGGLVAALMGLMLLEQIHRNAAVAARREMRFLLLGVGGLFTFDLFLYSQAELFHRLDASSWYARGVIDAALVPLIVAGARRLPHVRFELYVSREVTFYTTAFLAVGTYVLSIAGIGFLIRDLNAQWGEAIRLVFFAGAVLVLMVLIGSDALRRRLWVFLSKHFYRAKYDYRVEWLRFIRTLSVASGSDVNATAVRSVAQILDSPGGVLYRQTDGATAFVPVGAWPGTCEALEHAQPIPATSPLVEFMRARRWIIDLRERERRPHLYDDVDIPAWLAGSPNWRIVSPIFLGEKLLGFFLLLEPPPPFRLMFEDRDLLNTAGQHVATLLAQQDADRRVAELSQFETYNRLTTFVMHDLKNCAGQLSLIVGNAARHKHNPEFVDDAFSTIARTSERITRLIDQLRRGSTDSSIRVVKLASALQSAIERCSTRKPQPVLESAVDPEWCVLADPERLIAAFEHVIRNAQEASGESGQVRITVELRGSRARISVNDTGGGMDADFIRLRLFRPFDTTKGPTGMGIGAYQAREFARSVGGDVEVQSQPGKGTSFAFDLPLAR